MEYAKLKYKYELLVSFKCTQMHGKPLKKFFLFSNKSTNLSDKLNTAIITFAIVKINCNLQCNLIS